MKCICLAAAMAASFPAAAQTMSVTSPIGNAFYRNGRQAPDFLDIAAASFTIAPTGLTFTVDVAGVLTSLPDVHGVQSAFFWTFPLDTDSTTAPPGFPFPPPNALPPEFIAYAIWDGRAFHAYFVDRRPALSGAAMVSTEIPVEVSGDELRITVPASLASQVVPDDKARWRMSTGWWPADMQADRSVSFADTTGWLPWPR